MMKNSEIYSALNWLAQSSLQTDYAYYDWGASSTKNQAKRSDDDQNHRSSSIKI